MTHDEIRQAFADGETLYTNVNNFQLTSSGGVYGCCYEGPMCCELEYDSVEAFLADYWGLNQLEIA